MRFVRCGSFIETQVDDWELEDELEKFKGEAKFPRYLLLLRRTKQESWYLNL
jgi:hypothetical protein